MHFLESTVLVCPYCAESIELLIDCSAGEQRYIEDCEVCCRPIDVAVALTVNGEPTVSVSQENDV